MATATVQPSQTTLPAATPLATADVMRRGIKRVLPCKLTEQEFMQIAKQRVDKEALLDQVVEDFDGIKSKHKTQVDELEGEIGKMRKELHTGEQDRTVLCVEVFHKAIDGTGWVHTLRMDTLAAVYATELATGAGHAEAAELAKERATVERRPATPTEAQRHLPDLDSSAGTEPRALLDQAAARQGKKGAAAPAEADDGVPEDLDADEDDGTGDEPELGDAPEDEPLDDDADAPAGETKAERAAREHQEGRAARRNGKGRRGKGGGK